MQELLNIKADFLALEDAVTKAVAGPTAQSVLDAFGAGVSLLADVKGIGTLFLGGGLMRGTAGEEEAASSIADCCDRIRAECAAEAHKVGAVEGLGDGTLLKELLAALPGLLAFIQAMLKKPAA